MTFWRFVILLSVIAVLYHFNRDHPIVVNVTADVSNLFHIDRIQYKPGVLVSSPPRQAVTRQPDFPLNEHYTIRPVAVFWAAGRVLVKTRYWFDRESAVSPYDIIVGWGSMSDESFIDKVSVGGGWRSLAVDYSAAGISPWQINASVANLHIIPANDLVLETIQTMKEDDVIVVKGYLVNVHGSNEWVWKTSLNRTDLGEGAGEIVWAEEVQIITDKFPRAE